MVGVCDSTSLIGASDVVNEELDDAILMEVCRVKASGASLTTLGNLGNKKSCNLFLFS